MLVIENRIVSYTPLCLKVVIEPFPNDFKGDLRSLGLGFLGSSLQLSHALSHPEGCLPVAKCK